MRCNNCGRENNEDAKYCTGCGYQLYSINYEGHTINRKSPLKIILLVLLIIVLLVGCVVSYIVFFDNSPVEVMLLANDNPGNVLDNPEISANIENTRIVQEICQKSGSGVPVVKIGDGNGPVTVIVAGVHGNQLNPVLAAIDTVNFLNGRKIKGTVYIIPFASPSAVEKNTKNTGGVNLNVVADESGSTSNKIVNFAIKNNASVVGDFHETEYGKDPGKTSIMCSHRPTPESYQLATKISRYTGNPVIDYDMAGVIYSGAIEDECNLKSIPAVTPLVVVNSHGTINSYRNIESSIEQMFYLLYVNGNIEEDNDWYYRLANYDQDVLKLYPE